MRTGWDVTSYLTDAGESSYDDIKLLILLYEEKQTNITKYWTTPLNLINFSFFSYTAPDVIPKNVKGVGTWRNNMEISWEVGETKYIKNV